MAQVRDIMQRSVITIPYDRTALEASRMLLEKDVSFVVVTRDKKPIGVVTERDFTRKLVCKDLLASETSLSDIMSLKFRHVEPATDIEAAVQHMLNHNVRRLLVIENGDLAGVITQTDLARHLRSGILIKGTLDAVDSD